MKYHIKLFQKKERTNKRQNKHLFTTHNQGGTTKMENKNRKRDIQLVFRVTAEEKAFIQEKMQSIGITNFREYARRMAAKGYVINVDSAEIKNLSAELQTIDVNIRQILRHVDRMGAHYASDAESIRAKMGENWDVVRGLFREALRLSQK